MASFADYMNGYGESDYEKKKKKKEEEERRKKLISPADEIAPVKTYTPTTTKKTSSCLDDGYDFGDISKTILGVAKAAGKAIVSPVVNSIKEEKAAEEKKQATFDEAMTKKYSSMSLSDLEKNYSRIEKEEKEHKEENGGKIVNTLTKVGSYLTEGQTGQSGSSTRAKSQANIDKIDDLTREKEILNIYRKQKATEEYLGGLDEKQLKMLDNIAEAKDLETAAPFSILAPQGGMDATTYSKITEVERTAGKESREKLYNQLKKKNPKKSDEEINELIDNMVELRRSQVNAQEREKEQAELQQAATEHPLASFLLSRGVSLLSGGGLVEPYMQRGNEYGLDTNAPGFAFANASADIDQQIQLDHDWKIGEVDAFDFFYKAGTGIVDNVARLAMSGGNTTLAGAMMFTQGTTQTIIEGKEKGYSDAKALTMGLLNGTFEAISEKMSLDSILGSSGGALKTLAKSFVAEGSEELTSNWLNRIADQVANGKHSDLSKMYEAYKNEGYTEAQALSEVIGSVIGEDFESFLIGGIAGAVMGGGVAISNAKQKNALDEKEQKVFDKVVEERIAEATEDGKKTISKNEETKIRKAVLNDMLKGYIDTDTIESVLGGEEYEKYKSFTDRASAYEAKLNEGIEKMQQKYDELQTEYNTLNKMKTGDMTGEQLDRRADIKKEMASLEEKIQQWNTELEEYSNDAKTSELKTNLKTKLGQSVFDLVKDSRLGESYYEIERSKQKFEADVSKYKNKNAQQTVQKAIDSGLFGNSNKAHELIDFAAKISEDKGYVIEFTKTEDLERLKQEGNKYNLEADAERIEAFVSDKHKTIVVNVETANKAFDSLIGHEVTHTLESAKSYKALQKAVKSYLGEAEYNKLLESKAKTYKGIKADIEKEIVADFCGERLLTDYDFVKHLSINDRNVFQKVWDEIKYLCKIATAGSKEARDLERVKRNFEKAYKESSKESGTQYSLAMVEAVQPTSEKWNRTLTTEEAKARFPKLWDVTADDSEVRNPTQISSTVKSYRKVYDHLKNEGFDGTILDASSGLGFGTKAGIEEYGFDVEDIEPYPDKNYNPKYKDYSSLNKKYDVVISNAVLNVLPQDQRDALVVKMGEMLNDGGRIFINVRGKDVDTLASNKNNTNISPMEWFVDSTGSYQKGFTKPELVAYLKDALGEGFSVKPTSLFGAVSAVVTKDSAKYSLSDEYLDELLGTGWIKNLGYKVTEESTTNNQRYKGDTTTKGKVAKLTDERIDRLMKEYGASDPKYAQAYITSIHPRDFLSLTLGDRILEKWDKAAEEGTHGELYPLNEERLKAEIQTPFLKVDTSTGEVVGHEGRHRMRALLEMGVTEVPIAVIDYNTKYSKQKEASLHLTSQDYGNGAVNDNFSTEIKNLIPLNAVNKSEILSAYGGDGDIKYSLSPEQEAYFKDSKVRDENGNLKVMYHGTSKGGFTSFDTYYGKYGLMGTGSYFTDNKSVAESYTNKGKGDNKQVYETYLNITNPIDMDAQANPEEWAKAFPDVSTLPESGTNEKFLREVEDYYSYEEMPRWEVIETIRDAIQFNMGYDGITHIGGGRFNKNDDTRHQVYIAFEPEQIKNIDNIAPTKDADIRYSLTEDSEGNKLTEKQSEYFKDSKAVDEKGSLKVVYHGTRNADFTVFKRNATYFTDSKEMADSYSPNGAMFEGYVNITKPYEIDAAGEKWSRIPIDNDTANFLKEYGSSVFKEGGKWRTTPADIASALEEAIDNGDVDYDGIIIKNIDDTGNYYKDKETHLATDYIAFNSNQFKKVDNKAPTTDPDIRFSLSENVEETKDLMALHNLHSNELMKQLKMGGIAYPSVAVTKPGTLSHEGFGDITLILNKDAIDPKKSKYNKLYSADAYTPTFPNVNYEASRDVANNIANKVKSLYEAIPEDYKRSLTAFRDYTNIDERLNSARGEEGLIERYLDDYSFKQLYLADKGEVVPTEIKRTETQITEYQKEQYQFVVDRLGAELLESSKPMDSYTPPLTARVQWYEQHGEALKEAYAEYWAADGTMTKEEALEIANSEGARYWVRQIKAITDYIKTGGMTIKEEADITATNALIDEKINVAEYKEWLTNLFSGIEGSSGIRNSKDLFTPSGKRRSFSQLHDPVTIDNVIKVMRKQGQTGQGAFGTGNIQGASAQEFGSIAVMKENSDRLGVMDEAEHEEITQQINDRIFEIAKRYSNGKDLMDAQTTIVEAVSKNETKAGIARYLKQFDYVYKYTDSIGDDIIELRDYIRSLPTPYFEAKPQRAVSFDEVAAFVIPRDADVKVKQELLNKGYAIAEYDPKIEGDRQRVVNSFEEYKFSLSDANETPSKYGRFFAKDVLYQGDDIAPTPKTEQVETVNENDYAPMTEAEAVSMMEADRGYINSFTDADMPPETDAPIYDRAEEGYKVESPLEDRDITEVGNRKVKAYMYENPEVKPFFQEAAEWMLGDLHDTVRGERTFNDELYYESGGELGWMGTKRHTSPEIADLLDNWHYTYDQIEKGLKAIIEDNGAENNAVSKRIEFALDEMLRNGHTFFADGTELPPNQEYINLLLGKQITEYNDEAFNYWLSTLTDEDIKAENVVQNDIAPTKAYEAIRPKPVKQPKMVRADKVDAEQPTANILTEESKVNKKKNTAWSKFKTNFVDKAHPFETLALKTGNREVDAKFNSIRYADGKAQNLIGKGTEGVKALNDIKAEVEKDGLTKALYDYLYHKHNVDRMTLEDRYDDVPNKAVFGNSVTAEASQEIVNQYEFAEPKLKEYAEEIYNYNKHLRNLLVEGGVISQETADLWEEMYPHYVPIRRVGDEGLNINVALDTNRTGVNAPIKRATGGNRDILPLFDTMAQRTLQTYKAISKNRFGIELKNTLGTTIESTETNLDEVIDSIDTQDGLLQEGKNGRNPTFTVFENGERVTFEITDEMYDALKPTSEGMAYTNKVLNKGTNIFRGLVTEFNPTFMLTNPIKDSQDVLINSQHPARTYKNFPKAVKELVSKKGKWYTEYMENGGADNTYFDKQTNTFNEEKSKLSKVIGFPLEKISEANNFIERIPRLAEYIASRESGRSVDVSMLDAARVTTNFAAGGDVTKFLNRNGATFLNASVQGAVQQARNVREAKANGLKGWVQLAAKVALAGLPSILLNNLMWDDDEEYEELSDYVKQNYYVVAKTQNGKFVRIPKGRALAVIQNAFEQVQNALTGDDEVDLQSFLELAVSNLAPNNPLDNNIIAPIKQVVENKTWYGEDLVPTRLQDLPAKEQYDESTDAISKWLGEKINVSPYKINYLLNQYSGGVGDVVLPMLTPEAESGNNSLLGNFTAPLRDKFSTDSVLNNKNPSEFYDVSDKLKVNANSSNATDEDILKNKYINSVSSELSELYKEKREIQNSNLSDDLKFKQVRDVQKQINDISRDALNTYENVNVNGRYATIGDKHYMLNDKGEWQKITDEQLKKQNEAIGILGITPSQYWSNKKEYDMAAFYPEKYAVLQEQGISVEDYKENYEESAFIYTDDYSWAANNPEKYTLSKAITDDFAEYRQYTSELNEIKADKDSNGKTISGSAKEKKKAYIWSLPLDYGQKIILYRSLYDSKDDRATYNQDIIDYLNSRDDITYDEMNTICEELGFTVNRETGYISWD